MFELRHFLEIILIVVGFIIVWELKLEELEIHTVSKYKQQQQQKKNSEFITKTENRMGPFGSVSVVVVEHFLYALIRCRIAYKIKMFRFVLSDNVQFY